MTLSALNRPQTDPTPLFELFRGNYAAELLTAAVCHFKLFDHLADRPLSCDDLRNKLNHRNTRIRSIPRGCVSHG